MARIMHSNEAKQTTLVKRASALGAIQISVLLIALYPSCSPSGRVLVGPVCQGPLLCLLVAKEVCGF